MTTAHSFRLRWNEYESTLQAGISNLRTDDNFYDVTLACGGHLIRAHKVILGTCSPVFKKLLKSISHHHPLLYLNGIDYCHLESLLSFMYCGEVKIKPELVDKVVSLAKEFQVHGLMEVQSLVGKMSSINPSIKTYSTHKRKSCSFIVKSQNKKVELDLSVKSNKVISLEEKGRVSNPTHNKNKISSTITSNYDKSLIIGSVKSSSEPESNFTIFESESTQNISPDPLKFDGIEIDGSTHSNDTGFDNQDITSHTTMKTDGSSAITLNRSAIFNDDNISPELDTKVNVFNGSNIQSKTKSTYKGNVPSVDIGDTEFVVTPDGSSNDTESIVLTELKKEEVDPLLNLDLEMSSSKVLKYINEASFDKESSKFSSPRAYETETKEHESNKIESLKEYRKSFDTMLLKFFSPYGANKKYRCIKCSYIAYEKHNIIKHIKANHS